MSDISIMNMSITKMKTDAIVNAANSSLSMGGGVCGSVFLGAGVDEMSEACNRIGHCDTGSAVITPGFNLPAKYVIHAVGPKWKGGENKEAEHLYNAYMQSLLRAQECNLHSIAFPLISSGRFHYPLSEAWEIAIRACQDFISRNPTYEIKIVFAVLNDRVISIGEEMLNQQSL